jgi:predicted HicB family RNase H-like nuclease
MEKTINIKVDSEFYKQIKVRVALADKTLKDYIIELIKMDLEQNTKEQKL